ncbi:hypothetical protein [Oceanobacter mangrovi]|uniref:hypothetical protein n=1 Tax=Oceanobacter mangrovi TaxID=2862510 RepID=UPI001C8D987F|nr:hypothetical protein [Oceanobacter mangrovi]
METTVDRFLALWAEERLSAPWLEEKTGVEAKRWYSIKQRKVMRTSELEALHALFPEYKVWLSTGDEFPEAGQISPMTKREQQNYKTPPKVG